MNCCFQMAGQWSQEETLELIDMYKDAELLWKPSHPDHINKNLRNDALENIAEAIGREPSSVLAKIRGLQSQLSAFSKPKPSGSAGGAQPKWFAYDRLQFLRDKNTPRCGVQMGFSPPQSESSQDSDASVTNLQRCGSKRKRTDDSSAMDAELLDTMKNVANSMKEKNSNEWASFGGSVAARLGKIKSRRIQITVIQSINSALFDAEIRDINEAAPSSNLA